MTPEEAIEILEEVKELDDTLYAYSYAYMEALEVALSSLKKIQNYRKLGTPEELARAKKYIDLAKKHGTIGEMINSCAEYEEIGTVEEFREAVEKQIPKTPIMKPYYDDMPDEEYLCCPTCGDILTDRIPDDNKNFYFHCLNCGQKFDWREEDTK